MEQDRRTAGLVRVNARTVGFPDAEVVTGSVARHLADPPAAPYDVVFLDPPYPLTRKAASHDLAALAGNGWLADEAIVVVERSSREPLPPWPPGYLVGRERRYGETTLSFATWTGRSAPSDPACYGRDDAAPEPP